MFKDTKKRISSLIDTVSEYLGVFCQLKDPAIAASDCLAALDSILVQLNIEDRVPEKTIEELRKVQYTLSLFLDDITLINEESVQRVNDQVLLLKTIFQDEVKAKLNVVFFPYKASMWDSLATVYEAAAKDEECIARVVPIPYYLLTQNEAIPAYEGGQFPENVPITHYSQYNLENEQPDIIFVHNIYDQYNTLTRVHEEYFTSNLKKYTDMLVFVPYHISSFIPPDKGTKSLAYNLPSVINVDKIILAGDYLKEAAIRDGIPAEKLLALGSPKLDVMVHALKEEIKYPVEWEEKLKGNTVYVINTGCLYFANNPFLFFELFLNFLNIPRFIENSVLIWRPHPLTHVSIKKYIPHFEEHYLNLIEGIKKGDVLYTGVILDEADDYLPALSVADVLISEDGSLLRSYLLTERKILFLGENSPKESLLPPNVFYSTFDRSEPWYELVKKFAKGYDPLAENRKGMAAKVYANVDGTSGEKVYQSVKDCLLIKGCF